MTQVVIDIGANEGGISLYAAAHGYVVVSFEVFPDNQKVTRQEAKGAGLQSCLFLVNGAVSDKENQIIRFIDGEQTTNDRQQVSVVFLAPP